jgi:hypothetical protein
MKDRLVAPSTVKLAKLKNFKEVCDHQYENILSKEIHTTEIVNINEKDICDVCSAPTQSLLQTWLRDEHNIHISINVDFRRDKIIYK